MFYLFRRCQTNSESELISYRRRTPRMRTGQCSSPTPFLTAFMGPGPRPPSSHRGATLAFRLRRKDRLITVLLLTDSGRCGKMMVGEADDLISEEPRLVGSLSANESHSHPPIPSPLRASTDETWGYSTFTSTMYSVRLTSVDARFSFL